MGYGLGGNDLCGGVCCARLSGSDELSRRPGLRLILSTHNTGMSLCAGVVSYPVVVGYHIKIVISFIVSVTLHHHVSLIVCLFSAAPGCWKLCSRLCSDILCSYMTFVHGFFLLSNASSISLFFQARSFSGLNMRSFIILFVLAMWHL